MLQIVATAYDEFFRLPQSFPPWIEQGARALRVVRPPYRSHEWLLLEPEAAAALLFS